MSGGSVARRSWVSFTGGRRPGPPRAAARGRTGYTLWQRVRASFTNVVLPPRAPYVAVGARAQAVAPRPPVHSVAPGWFPLPRLSAAGALTASGADAVVLEASSPDRRSRFLLRRTADGTAAYSLELVVGDAHDEDRPLLYTVAYARPDGRERVLLVPVVRGGVGPAASYVRLSGFVPGVTWAATGPSPVPGEHEWDPVVVADSVGAALNEATREAWRRVRELLSGDVRDVIDGALR
ncbi:hypothetical protein [Streptomyces flavofungini]|uniref:hypothetical protein n=1 Tax=Streptomyces flavofungini TaxID=68200 RepID=UPI0034DE49D5